MISEQRTYDETSLQHVPSVAFASHLINMITYPEGGPIPTKSPEDSTKTSKLVENEQKNCYRDEMKPLLFGLALTGRFPYKRAKNGEYKCCLISFTYWILMFILLSIIAVEQLVESVNAMTKGKLDFVTSVEHGVVMTLVILLQLSSPFCVMYERKTFVSLLNEWPKLIQKLEETTGATFKPSYSKIMKILAFLVPLMAGGACFVERGFLVRGKYYRALFYVLVFQGCHYQMLFWWGNLMELGNIAKRIVSAITKAAEQSQNWNTALNLEDLRKCWLDASILVRQVGGALSSTICCMSICLVTLFIVSTFTVISSFIHTDYRNRTDYVVIAVFAAAMLSSILEPAQRATDALGSSVMTTLSSVDFNRLPPQSMQSVEFFRQTISLNYPSVSLEGLTTVNRSWLVGIAASVITYIIVLVQFQTQSISTNGIGTDNSTDLPYNINTEI